MFYKNLSRTDRERIMQFILCAIFGMAASKLLGGESSPTIAISAILMLYTDRGFIGSLHYNRKRIGTQLIIGPIVAAVFYVLSQFLPFERWLIGVITACIGIAIGLPIEYRFKIAPLTVSIGNAVLIITTGILARQSYLPYLIDRLLYVVIGATIAMAVRFIIMPRRDRFKETESTILESTSLLFRSAEFFYNAVLTEVPQQISVHFQETENNIALLMQDGRLKWFRYKINEIQRLKTLFSLEKKAYGLLKERKAGDHKLPQKFKQQWDPLFMAVLKAHENYIKCELVCIQPLVENAASIMVKGQHEIKQMACFWDYLQTLQQAADIEGSI